MYPRKKRNKSGSVSVQVIQKQGRKNLLIKTIGCSDDPVEIDRLFDQAKAYIEKLQGQSRLDLFSHDEEEWFSSTFNQIKSVQLIGPELILGKIFDDIGFNQINEELFRHLVISRIISPASKLRTIRYLQEYKNVSYSVQQVYRYLDKLYRTQKTLVEHISFAHTVKVLGSHPSVVFYDVTTIYFEAEKEDDLRIAGFSKEGKHKHPQIILGLLVSIDGYPLAYELFKGNTYEGHTLMPVIDAFKNRFKLDQLVIVADSGLLSNKNIEALISKGYEFILGARIKSESKRIKDQILSLRLKNGQTKVITKQEGIRLIISYSERRAKKDSRNRQKGIKKLEKSLSKGKLTKQNINNRGYNKYLKIVGDLTISIDYEKFNRDGSWDGLKGYLTNTTLDPKYLIDNYNELWKIEKAFRISKTDLRVRPIYHRLERRIEAHICISFAAYKVYKELDRILKTKTTKISVERAIELMKTIYGIILQHPESRKTKQMILTPNKQQIELLKLLEIERG